MGWGVRQRREGRDRQREKRQMDRRGREGERWTGRWAERREGDGCREMGRQVHRWETQCQGNRKGETVGRKRQKYRGKQNQKDPELTSIAAPGS